MDREQIVELTSTLNKYLEDIKTKPSKIIVTDDFCDGYEKAMEDMAGILFDKLA